MINARIPRLQRLRFRSPPPRRTGFTVLELGVALFIVAVLIALFLPAQRRARPAARRTQCKNNLKQIGLALHNYKDVWGAFPPAYSVDADGKPLHSWRTLILPYVDQASLFNQLNLSKPWDDPANAVLMKATVRQYHCASSPGDVSRSNYLAIVTPGSIFGSTTSRTQAEITDGTSNTLMVIEVPDEQAVPWYAPQDADETVLQGFGPKSKELHTGGRHALFADGAVRFLSQNIDAKTFQALLTATGGETLGEY